MSTLPAGDPQGGMFVPTVMDSSIYSPFFLDIVQGKPVDSIGAGKGEVKF